MLMKRDPGIIIFDVEGTLIDCASQSLESWQKALAEFGHSFHCKDLQPYSGMDASDMLLSLLPAAPEEIRKKVANRQGEIYESQYLHGVKPFPGIKDLFTALKKRGFALAIATSCKHEELDTYDRSMAALRMVDVIECGDEVDRGKPHPDLFRAALKKLDVRDGTEVISIGDTPYDARAVEGLGIRAVGVLTGGFSRSELERAGCGSVIESVTRLEPLQFPRSANASVSSASQPR